MNNLSNTAKKLDKVLEIAYIVLGAMSIGFLVCAALIAVAYIFKLDFSRHFYLGQRCSGCWQRYYLLYLSR